ncbi:MAG: hypothetical protein IRZ07_00675 [Microbispora sp.]|jgi:hypothetical protein|nr:hypothetical protein [Microbispora sp.]
MDIKQAKQELDEIVAEIEQDGFASLDYEDLPCLLKALAALETCETLGGR